MLVRDVMTKDVLTVSPDDRVADVARKITQRHISGVFVTEEGRLVGKVSHSDLLRHIFPSYSEFYDDLVHSTDFEQIETRARDLVDRRARDVMEEETITVGPDTPILKVASWMLLKDVHRAAVVDEADKLLGVISRGDIFYHTIRQEMAAASLRRFAVAAAGRAKAPKTRKRSRVKA